MDGKIPEFRPTLEEMRDFSAYVKHMEEQGAHKIGVAKVIPPAEYVARSAGYDDVEDMLIQNSIKQVMAGRGGAFQVLNVEQKPKTVREFRELANSAQYAPPAKCANNPEELERTYWKNLGLNPPIYGADIPGTLTDADQSVWNIQKLGTILDIIGETDGPQIQGVNTAYLYFGMWKASFVWHTEDMDLYSINYIHYGEPKTWYCIPPSHADRFESLAAQYFSGDFKACRHFLRHKMFILSPSVLRTHSIPCYKTVHRKGEFMITFPRAYHAGFNHGFNCAESTNFASERWIDFGKRAGFCQCKPDTVRIEMGVFVKKFQPELWRSPSPTPSLSSAATSESADTDLSDDDGEARHTNRRKQRRKRRSRDGCAEDATEEEQQRRKRLRQARTVAKKRLRARLRKRQQAELRKQQAAAARVAAETARVQALLDAVRRTNRRLAFSNDDVDGAEQRVRAARATDRAAAGFPTTGAEGVAASACLLDPNLVKRGTIAMSEHTGSTVEPDTTVSWQPAEPCSEARARARCSVCMQWGTLRQRSSGSHATRVVDAEARHASPVPTSPPAATAGSHAPAPVVVDISDNGTGLSSGDADHVSNGQHGVGNADEHGSASDSLAEELDSDALHHPTRHQRAPETTNAMQYYKGRVGASGWCASTCLSSSAPEQPPAEEKHGLPSDRAQYTSSPELLTETKTATATSVKERSPGRCYESNGGIDATYEPAEDAIDGDDFVIACRHCEVVVHRRCYGVPVSVQAQAFLCAPCAEGCVENRQCCLCPSAGGALKPVEEPFDDTSMQQEQEQSHQQQRRPKDRRWAHVSCAMYIQETTFGDAATRSPVLGVDAIHRLKRRLKCVVCTKRTPAQKKREGVCIQCTRGKCTTAFHVTCALEAEYPLHLLDGAGPYHYEALCVRHRPRPSGIRRAVTAGPALPVVVGSRVLARWRSDGFWPGVVTEILSSTFCNILFPDGSESTDVAPEFVQRAPGDGQHGSTIDPQESTENLECNADVIVQWTDNQFYAGTFVKYIRDVKYAIDFDDGHRSKVPLSDIRDINDTTVKLGVSIIADAPNETQAPATPPWEAAALSSDTRTTRALKVNYHRLLQSKETRQ
eukprot:m.978570 g.978570  ORF g.978570 m.978570 type:complete len:1102 (-) comp23960_c0_seq4:253-3558(-)